MIENYSNLLVFSPLFRSNPIIFTSELFQEFPMKYSKYFIIFSNRSNRPAENHINMNYIQSSVFVSQASKQHL